MIVLGSTNKDDLPILENSPYANGHKNIKIAQVQSNLRNMKKPPADADGFIMAPGTGFEPAT